MYRYVVNIDDNFSHGNTSTILDFDWQVLVLDGQRSVPEDREVEFGRLESHQDRDDGNRAAARLERRLRHWRRLLGRHRRRCHPGSSVGA